MFEPIHGSGFDIAGQGIANPIGAFWTAAMMLEHLGEATSAKRLMNAIEAVTGAGIHARDLGGTATTAEITIAVRQAIADQAAEYRAAPSDRPTARLWLGRRLLQPSNDERGSSDEDEPRASAETARSILERVRADLPTIMIDSAPTFVAWPATPADMMASRSHGYCRGSLPYPGTPAARWNAAVSSHGRYDGRVAESSIAKSRARRRPA